MFNFEKLNVYQGSLIFVNDIYTVAKKFPKEETFGLRGQLTRAVVSISLNIAEGTSRTNKDFRRFIDISRGSCYECIAILAIVKQQGYIAENEYNNLYESCSVLFRMLSKLKTSIKED